MGLSAVAPRITPLRNAMMVFVQIPESVTRLIVMRMLLVMVRSLEILVVVEYAILLANAYPHVAT
jgi:hypothetical protein